MTGGSKMHRRTSSVLLDLVSSSLEDSQRHSAIPLPAFSAISLVVVWALDLIASFVCFAMAEVYQSTPEFPRDFVVMTGVALTLLACILPHFLGRRRHGTRHWKLYQPFRGGQRFVVLQAFGILLVALSVICAITYLSVVDVHLSQLGQLSVISIASLLGNVLIMLSVRYFRPHASKHGKFSASFSSANYSPNGVPQRVPRAEIILVGAFCAGQAAIMVVGSVWPTLARSCAILLLVAQAFTFALIYLIIGCRYTPGFRWFMFRLQRRMDTLIMWVIGLLMALAFGANALLIQRHRSSTPAGFIAVTSFNVFVSCAFLLFVRTTPFKVQENALRTTISEYGGFAVCIFSALLGAVCILAAVYVQHHHAELSVLIEGTEWTQLDALMSFLTLLQGFSLLLAPIVQSAGRAIHGPRCTLFTSARLPPTFIVVQGAGWLAYVLALLNYFLFVTAQSTITFCFSSLAGVLSVLFITFSIRVFADAPQRTDSPTMESPRDGCGCETSSTTGGKSNTSSGEYGSPLLQRQSELEDSGDQSSVVADLINGQLILAYVCGLTNLMVRIIVDISLQEFWEGSPIPRLHLIALGSLGFILSVPLAHLSGRDKGIQVFRPFHGSGRFIAFQVLGWAMYSLILVLGAISIIIVWAEELSLSMVLPKDNGMPVRSWCSIVGLFQLFPLVLITLSIEAESRVTVGVARMRCVAAESYAVLHTFFKERYESETDEVQRRVLQLAFRTMMAPALERYEIGESGEVDDLALQTPTASPLLRTADQQREMGDGVGLIIILTSCGCATFFLLSSMFAHIGVLHLAFAVCGFLTCTATCIGLHAGYGVLRHGSSGLYKPFMPFQGGSRFIAWQAMGWAAYSLTFLLTLIAVLEPHMLTVWSTISASVFSVLAQWALLRSIPTFTTQTDFSVSSAEAFLAHNGEGMVAILTFASAMVSGWAYESMATFMVVVPAGTGGASTAADSHPRGGDFFAGEGRVRVPFILTVLGLWFAVPCVLIALGRTTRQWERVTQRSAKPRGKAHRPPGSPDADEEPSPGESSPPMIATFITNVLEVAVLIFSVLSPMSLFFVVYYLSSSFTPRVVEVITAAMPLVLGSLLFLTVIPFIVTRGLPNCLVCFQCGVITCCLYCLPVLIGAVLFSPALILPSAGTYYLTINTFVLTTLGLYRQVRLLLRLSGYAVIGAATFFYYDGVMSHGFVMDREAWTYLINVVLVLAWLRYLRRYEGKPSLTGAQRSAGFIDFCRHHIFNQCVRYFSFRIILDDPSVSLREEDGRRYFFSFHPHGVFPGTAMWAALTEEWQRVVGTNTKAVVTTHVASIIFNVPGVRDFNLLLGALSVTRASIVSSLERGNSVCVVTGGQAEMLHTRMSRHKMTLVTQHVGFIRLAIAQRVPLVPLLCLAENNLMGLVSLPKMQRYTLRWLGFPFPTIPYGRFGLPLPFATPLTLIVGRCINIPEGASADNEEDVRKLAELYFSELKELFYRHRVEAGYPEMELELVNDKERRKLEQEKRAAAKASASS